MWFPVNFTLDHFLDHLLRPPFKTIRPLLRPPPQGGRQRERRQDPGTGPDSAEHFNLSGLMSDRAYQHSPNQKEPDNSRVPDGCGKDPLGFLGGNLETTKAGLRKLYLKKARENHPDKNKENGTDVTATLNACYAWIPERNFLRFDEAIKLYREKRANKSARRRPPPPPPQEPPMTPPRPQQYASASSSSSSRHQQNENKVRESVYRRLG